MDSDLLSRLPIVETPPSLFVRVMRAIERARTRRLYVRFAFASSVLTLCVGFAIVYRSAIQVELTETSFVEFMRLIVSDPDIVLKNAKDLALGVIETLPYATILLALAIVVCLVGIVALADALRHIRRSRLTHHLSLN